MSSQIRSSQAQSVQVKSSQVQSSQAQSSQVTSSQVQSSQAQSSQVTSSQVHHEEATRQHHGVSGGMDAGMVCCLPMQRPHLASLGWCSALFG